MTLPSPQASILARDPKTIHRLNCNAFQQHGLTSAFGWQYATFYVAAAAPNSSSSSTGNPSHAGHAGHTSYTTHTSDLAVESPRYVCVARRRISRGRRSSPSAPSGLAHHLADGDADDDDNDNGRGKWQSVILDDYAQTTEDGHNTISLGISHGDGRLHLVWDLHNDRLRYRRSVAGLAWSEGSSSASKDVNDVNDNGGGGGGGKPSWSADAFGPIEDGLKPARAHSGFGALEEEEEEEDQNEVTYPRFVCVEDGELLFECRVGRAGNGDAVLCRYGRVSVQQHHDDDDDDDDDGDDDDNDNDNDNDKNTDIWRWSYLGTYLHGRDCSPYINGIHFDRHRHKRRLWVTWTNRRFTERQRESDRSGGASQQAGPNGPENNEDVGCMFSDDGGRTWLAATHARPVLGQTRSGTLDVAGEGVRVVDSRDGNAIVRTIPRDSGIMNQEGQCVDSDGGIHVLMRDNHSSPERSAGGGGGGGGGKQVAVRWKHHWQDIDSGTWHTSEIPGLQATSTGSRGKICCEPRTGDIYFVIPGNVDSSLAVLSRRRAESSSHGNEQHDESYYGPFEQLWSGHGFDGEPLVDEEQLLAADGRLSVMTRTAAMHEGADVVVLDWDLGCSVG